MRPSSSADVRARLLDAARRCDSIASAIGRAQMGDDGDDLRRRAEAVTMLRWAQTIFSLAASGRVDLIAQLDPTDLPAAIDILAATERALERTAAA